MTDELRLTATPGESIPISDALTRHYRAHDLPADGGVSDPWFRVRIGPVTLRLPNPPGRRRAVVLHDINHVVTGYNTTFAEGEMAIAGFEVGAGCGQLGVVWFINLSMMALGSVICPRAVFEAFVRGRRSVSIYHGDRDAAALSAMSVTEARSLLQLDAVDAPVGRLDYIRFAAWAAMAWLTLLAPPIAILSALWAAFHAWIGN